ncbi:MAG TPA: tRNA pseudouridine(38-40) synthase TruA [Planctomycetota bacterium]|nr:tRNA pseudouridine(38-40) synthase TruA [Planctomycetota bacterium]
MKPTPKKKRKGPPLRNLRLEIEYDGTRYFGWQIQDGKPTIQGEVERAIKEIAGAPATLIGSGRTDAGVHAVGQVANFRTACRIPDAKWPLALNAHLPADIRVVSAKEVPLEFHAQFGAKRKTYVYTVLNRDVPSAIERDHCHHIRRALDVAAMNEAAQRLVGTHDFRAFGSEMGEKEKTVRTIDKATVMADRALVRFVFRGSGFLYNQVRAMVGTLIDVGLGKQPPDFVMTVLEGKDRTKAGANVPAKGLCLISVEYE